MQTTKLRDQLGVSLRGIVPPDFDIPMSMWDLLSAVERAEHDQILRHKQMPGRRPIQN